MHQRLRVLLWSKGDSRTGKGSQALHQRPLLPPPLIPVIECAALGNAMDAHDSQATPAVGHAQHAGLLRVFLFTDLVDSTGLKQRLGDTAAAALISQHNELVRGCLKQHAGTEIDNAGDGFFATFDGPSAAVLCALDMQWRLAHLDAAEHPQVRIGIHTGEAQLVAAPLDGLPAKPVGLAVDTAARIMSLAQGRQILLTRPAFDSARQEVVNGPSGTTIVWLAHGPYRLAGIDEPMEVCETGVEGLSPLYPPPNSAKAVRDVSPADEDTLGWRPAAGHEIPGRAGWVLQRKLGEGGFGEIWLATDAQTGTCRAWKFCFAPERLRTLKRELALIRLIREALGDRPDIVHIHDVHLNAPPYFLELDYSAGGDLNTWAEARGGMEAVPIALRLSIVSQIAQALAAAHSVGVIHKDVKPGNILIDNLDDGTVQVRLTDFGIGQLIRTQPMSDDMLPRSELDSLSLTELSSRTGTRLYMAPELLAGRTPSIQSDIYSLGVLLYQVVAGDLRRPLGQGWERDIDDDLLREDVRACVDRSPEQRLASASELAARLNTLEERHNQMAAQREAQDAAQRAHRRRRLLAWSLVFAVIIAAAASVIAVRERDRASREARLRASAVKAAETMARELARGIKPIAGTQLRTVEGVLTAAARVYDDLLRDSPTTDALSGKAAMLNDFADIYLQANSTTKAAASAKEAAEIWLNLWQAAPTTSEMAFRGFATSALERSRIAQFQGDSTSSLQWARGTLIHLTKVADEIGCTADLRAARADALERTCRMEWERGNLTEAAVLYDKALRLRKELARGPHSDAVSTRGLAQVCELIGDIHGPHEPWQSLSAYGYASELLTLLVTLDTANADWQLDLARIQTSLAELHSRETDEPTTGSAANPAAADAERLAQSAAATCRRFVGLDPANLDWQRQLLRAEWILSDLTGREPLLSAVTRQLSATLALRDRVRALSEADPHNVLLQNEVAAMNSKAATALTFMVRKGQRPADGLSQARLLLTEARKIWQRLATDDPASVRWHNSLQRSYYDLGSVASAEGNTTEAEAARLQSASLDYSLYRQLARQYPGVARYQQRLEVYCKLAAASDRPEAIVGICRTEAADTAVSICAALARKSLGKPDTQDYRGELAEALRIQAVVEMSAAQTTSGTTRLAHLDKARRSCENANELYSVMLQTGHARAQDCAAAGATLDTLADVLRLQGDPTGAATVRAQADRCRTAQSDAAATRTLAEPSTSRASRAALFRAESIPVAQAIMLAAESVYSHDPSVANAMDAARATLEYSRLNDMDSTHSRATARQSLDRCLELLNKADAVAQRTTAAQQLRSQAQDMRSSLEHR